MIKVAVIDDKPMIRQAIVKAIDWEHLNCTVAGTAEDGLEGQELLARELPDLLITDIRMPGLSGIELAGWMADHLPQSRTILITGHQEFEYARMAVKQGVYDLIVKPIDYDDLHRVIDAAVTELTQARRDALEKTRLAGEVSRLAAEFARLAPTVGGKLLADALGGRTIEEREWREAMRAYDPETIRFSLALVRCVRLNGDAGFDGGPPDGLQLVSGLVREISGRMSVDTLESFPNGHLAVVLLFRSGLPQREMEVNLRRFGHELAVQCELRHGVVVNIASSSFYRSLSGLRPAYEETVALLERGFFLHDRKVLTPQMSLPDNRKGKQSIVKELDDFARTLEKEPKEKLLFEAERLMERLEEYSAGSTLVLKALLSEVCLLAVRCHYRHTGNEFALDKGIDRIVSDVSRLNSLPEARDYVLDIVLRVKSALDGGAAVYSRMTQLILDYINLHYDEEISLTSVAEHFKLSPNYMSRMVRQETGENFVGIVAKMRIQAAKRLLEDPTRKVNEVGAMVGYKEYAYFYYVFKRLTGLAPKEYQQSFLRDEPGGAPRSFSRDGGTS
ncbi:response regulator transcription factor [Paenibacillus cymbidii]|uniref:response regulator transcription factor n=1 Tax=Paenibacillus cymbidii TaxID=1639034 RepID=UPI0014369810|nr:response regulator [Paenibacillus cymbidii]